MKKGVLFFSFILLFSLLGYSPLMAQYEEILKPQTKEEINLYKKLKVKMEQQKIVSKVNNGKGNKVRLYSPEGQLLGSFDYTARKYYKYDEQGRVIAMADTVLGDDNKYKGTDYSIRYGDNGMPELIVAGNVNSIFKYDTATMLLKENLTSDSPALNYYKFDKMGLVESGSLNRAGQFMTRHGIEYRAKGVPMREYVTNYYEEAKDSMTIFYIYDEKNQLKTKQVFLRNTWYTSEDNAGRPTGAATHNEAGIYNYTYDEQGRVISEDYTNSVTDQKSHYITYKYYDNGLIKEVTEKYGKQEPAVINYTYTFYE